MLRVSCQVPFFGYSSLEGRQPKIRRLQLQAFGAELRKLLTSSITAERELAGIIVSEIDALCEAKEQRKAHPHEDRLNGKGLDGIGYLRLYKLGSSVRVYFTLINSELWMLELDANKRATNLTDGMKTTLANRLREAQQVASKQTRDK